MEHYYILTYHLNGCIFFVQRRRNCTYPLFTQDRLKARKYKNLSCAKCFLREIEDAQGKHCHVQEIYVMSQQKHS